MRDAVAHYPQDFRKSPLYERRMPIWLEILLTLLLILAAAEIFTNALEHLREHQGISEGVTGSIFAAIGAAMAESMVPLVAMMAGGADRAIRLVRR